MMTKSDESDRIGRFLIDIAKREEELQKQIQDNKELREKILKDLRKISGDKSICSDNIVDRIKIIERVIYQTELCYNYMTSERACALERDILQILKYEIDPIRAQINLDYNKTEYTKYLLDKISAIFPQVSFKVD